MKERQVCSACAKQSMNRNTSGSSPSGTFHSILDVFWKALAKGFIAHVTCHAKISLLFRMRSSNHNPPYLRDSTRSISINLRSSSTNK